MRWATSRDVVPVSSRAAASRSRVAERAPARSARVVSVASARAPAIPNPWLGEVRDERCLIPIPKPLKRDWGAAVVAGLPNFPAVAQSRSRADLGNATAAGRANDRPRVRHPVLVAGARGGRVRCLRRFQTVGRPPRSWQTAAVPDVQPAVKQERRGRSRRKPSRVTALTGSGRARLERSVRRTKDALRRSAMRRIPSKIGTCLHCRVRSVGR